MGLTHFLTEKHIIPSDRGAWRWADEAWEPCERGCDPQAYGTSPWNAALKDKLENRLHREMCAGRLTLEEARDLLVNDWRKACVKYDGNLESRQETQTPALYLLRRFAFQLFRITAQARLPR